MVTGTLRHAVRAAQSRPGTYGSIVLTLALGIGGTTAVFTVVDGLLVHPLPYPESDRLFEVWTEQVPGAGRSVPGLDGEVARFLREESAFESVELYQFGAATLTGAGDPAIVVASRVSPGLLRLMGASPRLGRMFEDDEVGDGRRVVLISEGLWKGRFGGAVDILGRSLELDEEPHAIVGVLSAGFGFPERNTDVWRPLAVDGERVQAVVRLPPGVSRASLTGRLETLSAQLRDAGLLPADRRLALDDLLQKRYGQRYAAALHAMLGAVSLVLLVACVNVTLLLLVRSTDRRGELAVRVALGARRSQLAIGVLLESLALAVLGSLGGVLVARALLVTILDLVPPSMMMLATVAGLDGRSLAFAVGLGGLTCLVVGVLPAARAARTDPIVSLRGRAPGTVNGGGEHAQAALVVGQIALVLVLLTGAGLLLRSFVRLARVDPGFDPAHLLVLWVQPSSPRYQAPGASLRLIEELEGLVEADPGVRGATFAEVAPPSSGFTPRADGLRAEGRPVAGEAGLRLPSNRVAPDYFATMGIPIVRGRAFARGDPEEATIVSDGLARRLWGGESPLGRRFRIDTDRPWLTVVGVARDVKAMGPSDPFGEGMELYLPFARRAAPPWLTLLVRTHGSDAAVLPRIKKQLWSLDERLPVMEATTMEHRLVESVARPRFHLRLALAFAGIAALLGGVGVHGTAAYRVARRRHELGVRIALGASRADIVALLLHRGVGLAVAGCAIGTAVSLAVTRPLSALLFETRPDEPAVLLGMAALLGGLVVAASYAPARQASRLDPGTVLRAE